MASVGIWLHETWAFLLNPNNRTVVGWIAAGILAAIIAILKIIRSRPHPTVSASNGVAAGGDVSKSTITITKTGGSKRGSDS